MFKALIAKLMTEEGLKLPVLQDRTTKQPSITYTMLVITFMYILGASIANLGAFLYSLYYFVQHNAQLKFEYFSMSDPMIFLGTIASLYFGRKTFNPDNKGSSDEVVK